MDHACYQLSPFWWCKRVDRCRRGTSPRNGGAGTKPLGGQQINMENELKLSLKPTGAGRLVKHHLLTESAPVHRRIKRTYFDTPDLRLHRERVVVRQWEEGERCLSSVSVALNAGHSCGKHYEWEARDAASTLDFSVVDDEDLREWLESVRGDLRPAFTTRFTRRAWVVQPRSGVRIEVALDRGWIEAEGRRELICELGVELLAGSATDLFSTVGQLQSEIALHPQTNSKLQRGYRVLADDPSLIVVKARPLPTDSAMTTVEAFRLIALACVKHFQGNEQGVLGSDDPEFIHQARVAIRRLRSAIRVWRKLLPETFVSSFDPRWQSLARLLGEARNWDVFLVETLPQVLARFPDDEHACALVTYAREQCRSNRQAVRCALSAADYSRLLVNFQAAVLALPKLGSRRLGAFAPRCLEKRARQVRLLAAEAISADAAARHRLRVACKRLRYALEFFSPLFAGADVFAYYHSAASKLQEVLGRLNDLAVASQLLEQALPGDANSSIAVWLGDQGECLIPDLGRLLDEFHQLETPWRIGESCAVVNVAGQELASASVKASTSE